jgi:hypothetical protein
VILEHVSTDEYAVAMVKTAEFFGLRVFKSGEQSKSSPEQLAKAAVMRFAGGGMLRAWVEELVQKTNSLLIASNGDLKHLIEEPMQGPIRAPQPPLDPDLAQSEAVLEHEGERQKIVKAIQEGRSRTLHVDAEFPETPVAGPLWVRLLFAALHDDKQGIADVVLELQKIEEGR